jgi:transcriptional regulator with PAS, ATPase and Fis domain
MADQTWFDEFSGAITITDAQGIILDMNAAAEVVFKDDGGRALIGKNVLDCHPEPARGQLERMLDRQQKNVYTIEKKGKKKLIYQTPWYKDGVYSGFVELSIEIPFEMPNFIRD